MSENRLLTFVEMSRAITERRQVLELNGHKPNTQDARIAIAQAQDAKTVRLLLQGVGEWLEENIQSAHLPRAEHPFSKRWIQALKEGRMPDGK